MPRGIFKGWLLFGESGARIALEILYVHPRLVESTLTVSLLEHLGEEFNLTYLFIAHDLSVVRHLCHRVAVMYLRKIVELADCDDLYDHP